MSDASSGRDADAVPLPADLTAHMGRFGRALRRHRVEINVGDEADALVALQHVDIGDPDDVYHALRATLKVRRQHETAFDLLFDRMWRRALQPVDEGAFPASGRRTEQPAFEVRRSGPVPGAGTAGVERDDHSTGYSPEARLRKKTFDECTPEDLADMQRLLDRLAERLAIRASRRRVPAPHRGVVDLRRSLRRSLAGNGDVLELARRRRAVDRPELVLLCDTSGSMDAYSRFLLAFAVSLERVAPKTETFAFNTSLTRLTRWISPSNFMLTLERLARGVDDWSGGTRIGECLLTFSDTWLPRVVSSKTTIIILSDGLDRGDVAMLELALLRMRRRARRILWLNPLMGDERYRPEARGMKAALPYIDRLVPAHNLAALEALLPLLSA